MYLIFFNAAFIKTFDNPLVSSLFNMLREEEFNTRNDNFFVGVNNQIRQYNFLTTFSDFIKFLSIAAPTFRR